MEDILKFLNIPGLSNDTNDWLNYFNKSLRTTQDNHSYKTLNSTAKGNIVEKGKNGVLQSMSDFIKSDLGTKVGSVVNPTFKIANSFSKPLDNTSSMNSLLDLGSTLGAAVPGYGWAVSGVLQGVNLADKLTAKKSKTQATSDATAIGYNIDINANAGTSYGGLFGNKKRKRSNKLTDMYDFENSKKISNSFENTQEMLSAKNSFQDVLSKNMQSLTGGPNLKLLSAKKGSKLNKKSNLIPEGALHARKHSLPDEFKANVTDKGIPVITYDEDGKIQQHVEIEVNEIIFSKDVTLKLENLHKSYKDAESQSEKDKISIEAGKFLTKEILENTEDKTGLLNEIQYEK